VTPKGECRRRRPGTCCHCGRRRPIEARGLCYACYETRAVRDLYEAYRRCGRSESGDCTEAELDALVAERSKPENLPDWWDRDAAEQTGREVRYGRTLLYPVPDPRRRQ
jgi:hypothetical protein